MSKSALPKSNIVSVDCENTTEKLIISMETSKHEGKKSKTVSHTSPNIVTETSKSRFENILAEPETFNVKTETPSDLKIKSRCSKDTRQITSGTSKPVIESPKISHENSSVRGTSKSDLKTSKSFASVPRADTCSLKTMSFFPSSALEISKTAAESLKKGANLFKYTPNKSIFVPSSSESESLKPATVMPMPDVVTSKPDAVTPKTTTVTLNPDTEGLKPAILHPNLLQ